MIFLLFGIQSDLLFPNMWPIFIHKFWAITVIMFQSGDFLTFISSMFVSWHSIIENNFLLSLIQCVCITSYQIRSVTQSCLTLCDPMNRSTPSLPVHYQLPELTQTHVHRVSDAIQPSHPLSSPSPPAPNPSQHQSLFQ